MVKGLTIEDLALERLIVHVDSIVDESNNDMLQQRLVTGWPPATLAHGSHPHVLNHVSKVVSRVKPAMRRCLRLGLCLRGRGCSTKGCVCFNVVVV